MNTGSQPTSSNAARLLAMKSAQSGRRVMLCDTTRQSEKDIKEKAVIDISGFPTHNITENLCIITGAAGSSFFTSKTFNTTIKDLISRFDQVFICTSNRDVQLGLMALLEHAPCLVVISGLRKTKKSDIRDIKSRQNIDLLFYD